MKRILWIMLLAGGSMAAHAVDLTQDTLQGSWRVTEFAGEANADQDYWEFDGDRFTQSLGGQRLSPDAFEVDGNLIDLGYARIEVTEFKGDHMTARMAGFEYVLEKQ